MKELEEFPQLETDRLILREMTLDDLDFYFRHFNNEKVVEGCCFQDLKALRQLRKNSNFTV